MENKKEPFFNLVSLSLIVILSSSVVIAIVRNYVTWNHPVSTRVLWQYTWIPTLTLIVGLIVLIREWRIDLDEHDD